MNRSLGGEKIVLHVFCFAYSLVSALVSPLLSYQTVFISTQEFPLVSISPAHLAGGKGRVSEEPSGAWVPS